MNSNANNKDIDLENNNEKINEISNKPNPVKIKKLKRTPTVYPGKTKSKTEDEWYYFYKFRVHTICKYKLLKLYCILFIVCLNSIYRIIFNIHLYL